MPRMYRTLPYQGGDPRAVAEVVNNAMNGKTNNSGTVTLATGGATTTTLFNERIGFESIILLTPLSASSAGNTAILPHGLFEHQATQTFTANTPTIAAIATEETAYGMSLASNQITVDYAGTYNIYVQGRFENDNSQIHHAYVWYRINGTDVEHSCVGITIPNKQGSTSGAAAVSVVHPLTLDASDYVEIVIAVDDADLELTAEAAQTTPYVRPSIPSLTVELIMDVPSQTSGTATQPYISDRQKGQATITHLPNNVADNTYGYIIVG